MEVRCVFETLSRIGKVLNDSGVLWGVGGSVLLQTYGLVERPNDIDILAGIADGEKAAALLGAMGEALPCRQSETYATRFFRRFMIGETGVDLMAGFAIRHPAGQYDYVFDEVSISSHREIEGVPIPFAALEDWFVAYQLIPGKEEKAARIEECLLRQGIGQPYLLERALAGCLPEDARKRISGLAGE